MTYSCVHLHPRRRAPGGDSRRASPRAPRRGLALVLVLAVIAIASIIGFAMLSSSALQAQVSRNGTHAAQGDYVAESAVQAALYYLQYPQNVPPGWGTTPGYYLYATDQTLGAGIEGTFDLQVKATEERDVYTIRAVGRADDNVAPRVITAIARVDRVKITYAGLFGGDITLPLGFTVNGPVQVSGLLTNLTGLLLSTATGVLDRTAYRTPNIANINWFGADLADGKYVMPDGTVGYAQQLLAAPVAPPVASANNPGRVFYYKSTTMPDLYLTSNVAISGTLVVKGGGVSIRANNITITPQPGMPALVVERDLNMFRTNVNLTANGVTFIGRNLTWTGLLNTGTTLRITGALLMPGGSSIQVPFVGGSAVITLDTNKHVPDLTTTLQPGKSVSVLAWNK